MIIMYSIAYPNMFTNSRTLLAKDHEATMNNLKLLLRSDKNALFGDPYFGADLTKTIYMQNNVILKDLVIDSIYTAILTFMPQIKVSRSDITVYSKNYKLYATIKATNMIDYTTDVYDILLTDTKDID